MMRAVSMLVVFAAYCGLAAATVETFSDTTLQTRYEKLTFELRCPKCQNQNIADSNAEIATDLRKKVAELLRQGKTDDEIVDYLIARYGDFVTYRPPMRMDTLIVWLLPVLLLLGGFVGAIFYQRRQRKLQLEKALDGNEQQELKSLLEEYGE